MGRRVMVRLRILLCAVTIPALMVTACGGGDGAVTSAPPVETGRGVPPPAFPESFPLPAGTTIGETVIDRVAHRSEMQLTFTAPLIAVVQYYTLALVDAGFVVDAATGDDEGWTITFSLGAMSGSIVFSTDGDGTRAVAAVGGT